MQERVLISGGAGFIGSYVAEELLRNGFRVRALGALVDEVHGAGRPDYLDPDVDRCVVNAPDCRIG